MNPATGKETTVKANFTTNLVRLIALATAAVLLAALLGGGNWH